MACARRSSSVFLSDSARRIRCSRQLSTLQERVVRGLGQRPWASGPAIGRRASLCLWVGRPRDWFRDDLMRAVWSFWSKPYKAHREGIWASQKHHLLSWVLSVATASVHYPDTELYTDDWGAWLLVDQLGLVFGKVSTDLN